MNKALPAIVLFAIFLSCGLPVLGQNSLNEQLYYAAAEGRLDTIQSLLKKGANIEALVAKGNESKRTPLIAAAENGRVDTVKFLLKKGANIEGVDEYDYTALTRAAGMLQIEVVRLLLNKGAKGSSGALISAISPDIGADVNETRKLDLVKLLLERGANIETRTTDGVTPLMFAAMYGDTDMVKLLLNKGASIEAKDRFGRTALFESHSDKTDSVQLLLERGANIEATDKFNDTALVRAAREGKIEVARLLLDRGAKRRSDALNAAACFDRVINSDISQRPVLVKLLLEKGAGIDARNKDGLTALVCAKQMQLASVVDLLEQAGQQRKQLEETQSNDPRVAFATYLSLFQRNPHDDFVREKILQIAPALAEPPAIPEEARQLFVLATDQIKQAGTPAALDQPIALLRKAMEIAPWWSNAYYNLSRALEMRGQYDDAIQQLNYYLKLTPPAADASEARAHLIVIQALRDTAAHK